MSFSSAAARPEGVDLTVLQPVLQTALDAVVVMDANGLVLDWNDCARQTFGWTHDEAVGRPVAELIIPESLRTAHRAGLKRLAETGEGRILDRRIELTGLTRDGHEIPVELTVTRWTCLKRGETVFLGFLRDLSETHRAADALRASETRLRVTQEGAQVGIAETDREGRFLRVNPAFCAIAGRDPEDLLSGWSFPELTHPDDRDADKAAYDRMVAGAREPYEMEKRVLRKSGEILWVNLSASAAFDDDGRFLFGIRILQDIHERKLGEARQRLLLNELNHRVKNILTLVRALAVQTGQGAPDVAAFNATFQERLEALAKSHDLLIRGEWRGASLGEVLSHELEPYAASALASPAVRLTGPEVRLDARASVALSLIAHELVTNAAKYGALSTPGGTVELAWRWIDMVAPCRIKLSWTERGGPPVVAPTRRGFGTKLIERLAQSDLGGEVEFDYVPDGLKVVLRFQPGGCG